MTNITRRAIGGLAFLATLSAALPAMAQRDPAPPGRIDGRLTMVARSAAVGVGYTWGDGTLYFRGRRYPFTVNGVSVAAVGYSRIVGHGRVYGLHRLSDFTGTYAAATGGVTAGRGIAGQFLQNGQGVQIRIDDVTRGAELSGSADGIQIALK